MPGELIRIFSDIHYDDRASRVRRLAQLRPLLEGVDHLVLNGDTVDTRPGPLPSQTAAVRAETLDFFPRAVPAVTFLTGNHDPDISSRHVVDLAGGQVFVTHGDVLFDNIVPWGRDTALIDRLLAEEMRQRPRNAILTLDERFAIWRRVAAAIPQRHQSEKHGLKYALRFASDTIWPPWRFYRVLQAWQNLPTLAAASLRQYRPAAKFFLAGHTHRPGWWRMPDDIVVINTGSFCLPLGGYAVDISGSRLVAREVTMRGGEFHPGRAVAEFALAEA